MMICCINFAEEVDYICSALRGFNVLSSNSSPKHHTRSSGDRLSEYVPFYFVKLSAPFLEIIRSTHVKVEKGKLKTVPKME